MADPNTSAATTTPTASDHVTAWERHVYNHYALWVWQTYGTAVWVKQ